MSKGSNLAKSKSFWDKEYKKEGEYLSLSESPSEDLIKFTKWIERQYGRKFFNPISSVVDLGCGNGRNIAYLSKTYGMRGFGFDISEEAIKQAEILSKNLPIKYKVRSISDISDTEDSSQTLVLDMMTSHFLDRNDREKLFSEISRILKPGGWFFWKTFSGEEDEHAKRLIEENPADEKGSYIHPKIGVAEHVFTEEELEESLEKDFIIHKIIKSERHRKKGQAFKRRSVSIYAQKKS